MGKRYWNGKKHGIFYAHGLVEVVECSAAGVKLRAVDDDCVLLPTKPVIRAEITTADGKTSLTFDGTKD